MLRLSNIVSGLTTAGPRVNTPHTLHQQPLVQTHNTTDSAKKIKARTHKEFYEQAEADLPFRSRILYGG